MTTIIIESQYVPLMTKAYCENKDVRIIVHSASTGEVRELDHYRQEHRFYSRLIKKAKEFTRKQDR